MIAAPRTVLNSTGKVGRLCTTSYQRQIRHTCTQTDNRVQSTNTTYLCRCLVRWWSDCCRVQQSPPPPCPVRRQAVQKNKISHRRCGCICFDARTTQGIRNTIKFHRRRCCWCLAHHFLSNIITGAAAWLVRWWSDRRSTAVTTTTILIFALLLLLCRPAISRASKSIK